jgi:hypothetical protein
MATRARGSVTMPQMRNAAALVTRHDCGVTTDRPSATSRHGAVRVRPDGWAGISPFDVVDLFVYVVVLNLAVEYLPTVISETFTLSLLTALVLKVALEVVLWLKGHILDWMRAATTRRARVAAGVALWVVAVGSKLVVLKLVDVVFGQAVSLGGFIPVTLLVMILLASRSAVRRLLDSTSEAAR